MGIEDAQAAHQKNGKAHDVDPVADAHRQAMPIIKNGACLAFPVNDIRG
jgi:hypothetical protein